MATDRDRVAFFAEAMERAGRITTRSMFGEYALYCDGRVVGFACDDQLFLKITPGSQALLPDGRRAPAYPGSKDYFLIEDELDDPDALARLVRAVAADVPEKKPRRKARSRSARR
jgi:TfoX/Sxy family transcriptional regulator of competence genes